MIERPKLPTCARCGLEIVSVGQYVNGEYIHIDCRHGDDELHRLRHDAERYRCARQNGILVIDVRGKSSSAVLPEEWDALIDAVRLGKERVSDE